MILKIELISSESDEFFFAQNFLEGSVALARRPHEARNCDDAGFAEVDGAVGIDLAYERVTSEMDSWMEEWSLEVRMRSVKSHLRGR